MREADIPTETMWSDIDWMKAYRNYEFDDNYAEPEFRAYVDELHANHQHYGEWKIAVSPTSKWS